MKIIKIPKPTAEKARMELHLTVLECASKDFGRDYQGGI